MSGSKQEGAGSECGRAMGLLVRGAGQVVRVAAEGVKVKLRRDMEDLAIVSATEDQGVSVAVDEAGVIRAIGLDREVEAAFPGAKWREVVDAKGGVVIPGLVDAHTHPVWAGDRVHEFAMKLAGATYMEVHKAGGGINFTVTHTRGATEDQLLHLLLPRLHRMVRAGTTMAECKSGYGLDVENEMKMLRVLERARPLAPLTISSTFCGAHSVPKGLTAEEATRLVVEEQLPAVKAAVEAGKMSVDAVDVFCERGVFSVEQSRAILQAGRRLGFLLNFHADELNPLGGAEMGASLGAEAMSHLEEVSKEGIAAMAEAGTVAVLLPTTAYILRLPTPPARDMIEAGVPVALGSDFNPNAFCLSMPLVMHLACVTFKLTLNEALTAATLHAAHALRKADTHGSLQPGKMGDMLVLDAPRWEHLVYQLGGADDVITHVIKAGRVVHTRPNPAAPSATP
ncbi:probable imidazolonepropionase [Scylla paramamosain]|uniref:probable imidazolonepropionase n=1 Tax=Scylla paramamosain TaxID=85552 RepID=UPI003082CADF